MSRQDNEHKPEEMPSATNKITEPFEAIYLKSINYRRTVKKLNHTPKDMETLSSVLDKTIALTQKHQQRLTNTAYSLLQKPDVQWQIATKIQAHFNLTLFDALELCFHPEFDTILFITQASENLPKIIKALAAFTVTCTQLTHRTDTFFIDEDTVIFTLEDDSHYTAGLMRKKIPEFAKILAQAITPQVTSLLGFISTNFSKITKEHALNSAATKKNRKNNAALFNALDKHIIAIYRCMQLSEQLYKLHDIQTNLNTEIHDLANAKPYELIENLLKNANRTQETLHALTRVLDYPKRRKLAGRLTIIQSHLTPLRPGNDGLISNPYILYTKRRRTTTTPSALPKRYISPPS